MELSLRGFQSVYKTALAAAGLQIFSSIALFGVVGFMPFLTTDATNFSYLPEFDDISRHAG